MAKRMSEADSTSDRSRVKVFYAEADGSAQSIQDLLRALTATMTRPAQVTIPAKLVPNARVAVETPKPEPEGGLFAGEDPLSETADSTDLTDEPADSAPRRKRGDGPKLDRNAGLVPADMNFVPSGKKTLRAFVAEKAPDTDMDVILVVGYYLIHELGLPHFGPTQVLAAFKHLPRPVPVDLKQTIRNMKKGRVRLSFNELEKCRLTTEGENIVEHEMPVNSSSVPSGK